MPYSLLTSAAQLKAAYGEDNLVFNSQGGLTVKSLDHCSEKLISTIDWHAASHAAEEHIHCYHGNTHADAFSQHHKLVMDLGHLSSLLSPTYSDWNLIGIFLAGVTAKVAFLV